MGEKTFTVATYAAGASLAAITLIYVFAPTYFLDGDQSSGSGLLSTTRKKGVVGLVNPANDCFVNSVLQALAGLGDLRLYLIRELHRRNLEDAWIYERAVPPDALLPAPGTRPSNEGSRTPPNIPEWKLQGLQSGMVTKSLKEILDSLNERPIYKKTISAAPFVRSLEAAFRQRISRQQQDAQEFLQVVAERLCDEYHAGRRARLYAKQNGGVWPLDPPPPAEPEDGEVVPAEMNPDVEPTEAAATAKPEPVPALDIPKVAEVPDTEDEAGFPMEGAFESQIECLKCGFKPRPTRSTFCTLTLNVPQTTTSTSLNTCFDGMFKTEYIDDFKCANCRLLHAMATLKAEMERSTSEDFKRKAAAALEKLRVAVETDPEHPPPDVILPDIRHAPKRRIARHIRVVDFPKILAIHLSRSIYDASHASLKNSAKVAFPERLPLGGLLQQRKYKLLALVTHKGSHHSGHYESFRRQNLHAPFSNANTFRPAGVYSTTASPVSTPRLEAVQQQRPHNQPHSGTSSPLTVSSSPDLLSPASGVNGSSPSLVSTAPGTLGRSIHGSLRSAASEKPPPGPTSAPRERDDDTDASSLKSASPSTQSAMAKLVASMNPDGSPQSAEPPRGPSPTSNGSARSQEKLAVPPAARTSSPPSSPSPVRPPSSTTEKQQDPKAQAQKEAKAKPQTPTSQQQQQQQQKPRLRKQNDRWWRISDEKIKEAQTREVLGMQREVYLLFYELERERPY